ncbi:MAG: tetratricopeptide repeat protein [Thermodesulfovibrionales bacterium]|nr:tetratricopeptide repeat protein [Thermodesulfovibrionales bacterium]
MADPNHYYNLGTTYLRLGQYKFAKPYLLTALSMRYSVDVAVNLSIALMELGELQDAENLLNSALIKSSDDTDILVNLAVCLKYQQRHNEALQLLEKSLALNPSDPDIYLNLGVIHRELLNLDEAQDFYKKAIEISPKHAEARYNLGLLYLLKGDFDIGWSYYMWRWKTPNFKNIQRPKNFWRGQKGSYRLLLISEQGFGDTLQAIRYAQILRQMGLMVSLQCPNSLKPLFEGQLGLEAVYDTKPDDVFFDYSIHLLDIPYVLKTDIHTIPSYSKYLTVKSVYQECFRELRKENRLKVGIAWSGSKTNIRGRYRSCHLIHLLPILKTEGAVFYSLQKEYNPEELKSLPDNIRIINMSGSLKDFAHTAGLISNLDLVITVDTAVAHLAGALGKPVWLMLHYSSDWRWMLNRSDSPWYPTMTIFRQDTFGIWDGVVKRIKGSLEKILEDKRYAL